MSWEGWAGDDGAERGAEWATGNGQWAIGNGYSRLVWKPARVA